MAVVKNLMIRAGADFSELEKELRKAQKTLKTAGKELTKIGKTMTIGVTVPIVGAGAVAFKMAADMQDAMGATGQIFKESSEEMKRWANNLESYYGIASAEALEYGNMMGSMLMNIGGLTEREAAKQSQTLIKLAGDLTAMYGGTTQDAVHALTGALKGNNTMLDNYGMAVNDAMIKTKALELGLYNGTGQMSLQAKQAATLALIMEQTGAAQGQAAREADGASGSMRTFTTELKNLATSIGEVLLPIITPIITGLNDIIRSFNNLSPTVKTAIVIFAGLAAALGPLLLVAGKIVAVIGTFSGALAILHGSTMAATPVMKGLAAIMKVFTGTTVASTAATTASTAATTASTLATKLATVAQAAFNLVLKASPIFWAIAGIVALGVAIYNIIKYWKEITAWIGRAWEALQKWNGAKTREISINRSPAVSKGVPKLATGAVIPPRSEFMAILGDQSSGMNIETPETLMRKIVREETKQSAPQPITIVASGNEAGLIQYLKFKIDNEGNRTGKVLVEGLV